MKKHTIVLGLGNPLMTDEGVGVCLVNSFTQQQQKYPDVEFMDAGTGGMNILHLIANRKKVIILDCAYMKTPPGTIKRFTPDQVESEKKLFHQSLHEADILNIIKLAKTLDQCPREIIFFGIEPAAILPGQSLTTTLHNNIEKYIAAIAQNL